VGEATTLALSGHPEQGGFGGFVKGLAETAAEALPEGALGGTTAEKAMGAMEALDPDGSPVVHTLQAGTAAVISGVTANELGGALHGDITGDPFTGVGLGALGASAEGAASGHSASMQDPTETAILAKAADQAGAPSQATIAAKSEPVEANPGLSQANTTSPPTGSTGTPGTAGDHATGSPTTNGRSVAAEPGAPSSATGTAGRPAAPVDVAHQGSNATPVAKPVDTAARPADRVASSSTPTKTTPSTGAGVGGSERSSRDTTAAPTPAARIQADTPTTDSGRVEGPQPTTSITNQTEPPADITTTPHTTTDIGAGVGDRDSGALSTTNDLPTRSPDEPSTSSLPTHSKPGNQQPETNTQTPTTSTTRYAPTEHPTTNPTPTTPTNADVPDTPELLEGSLNLDTTPPAAIDIAPPTEHPIANTPAFTDQAINQQSLEATGHRKVTREPVSPSSATPVRAAETADPSAAPAPQGLPPTSHQKAPTTLSAISSEIRITHQTSTGIRPRHGP
jgi:hypothetical protein